MCAVSSSCSCDDGWTKVPNWLPSAGLGAMDVMVYFAMRQFARPEQTGGIALCWASVKSIAAFAGVDVSTIRRARKRLLEAGAITHVDNRVDEFGVSMPVFEFPTTGHCQRHDSSVDDDEKSTALSPEHETPVTSDTPIEQESQPIALQPVPPRATASTPSRYSHPIKTEGIKTKRKRLTSTGSREDANASSRDPSQPEPLFELPPPAVVEGGEKAEKPAKPKRGGTASGAELYELAKALAKVSGVSYAVNKERLFRLAKRLARAGVRWEEVERDYGSAGSWYRQDFRGVKGQRPTPEEVVATWGRYLSGNVIGDAESQPTWAETPVVLNGDEEDVWAYRPPSKEAEGSEF